MGGIGARIAWLALVFAVNSMLGDGSRCDIADKDFRNSLDKAASRSGIGLQSGSQANTRAGCRPMKMTVIRSPA